MNPLTLKFGGVIWVVVGLILKYQFEPCPEILTAGLVLIGIGFSHE